MHFKIALKNLAKSKVRTLLTLIAITIGIASLTFLISLEQGIKKFITESFLGENSLTQLIAKPDQNALGFLSPITASSNQIEEEKIEKIRKIPHVKAVYPESSLGNFVSLQINLFGQWFESDSMVFGIPFEFLEPGAVNEKLWKNANEPYPAVISTKLLDLYNFTVAPSNNLPSLNKNNFLGTEINILINHSTLLNKKSDIPPIKAKIVGFSDKVNLLGISMPQEIINEINTKYNSDKMTKTFLQAYIQVDQLENLDFVKNEIAKLNLKVISSQDSAGKIEANLKIFTLVLSVISTIILIVTGLMIANTFLSNLRERYRDIGILRAIGATQKDIKYIFLIEAGIIGALGAVIGILLSVILSMITNQLLLKLVANISLKPTNFFHYEANLIGAMMIFSIAFSIIFAFLPAKKAAKLEPLVALNS